MEAYLDNSATTRCYEEVKDIVVKTMLEDYGNPSAMHLKGVEAENYVKQAAKEIAKTLKVQEKEIFFTSGGTESDNWAVIGTALANIASIVDPEVFVIGGGVSRAGAILIDGIKKHFTERTFHACEATEITLATLGNDAGMYGCVRLLF